jgi:hypothetical protein
LTQEYRQTRNDLIRQFGVQNLNGEYTNPRRDINPKPYVSNQEMQSIIDTAVGPSPVLPSGLRNAPAAVTPPAVTPTAVTPPPASPAAVTPTAVTPPPASPPAITPPPAQTQLAEGPSRLTRPNFAPGEDPEHIRTEANKSYREGRLDLAGRNSEYERADAIESGAHSRRPRDVFGRESSYFADVARNRQEVEKIAQQRTQLTGIYSDERSRDNLLFSALRDKVSTDPQNLYSSFIANTRNLVGSLPEGGARDAAFTLLTRLGNATGQEAQSAAMAGILENLRGQTPVSNLDMIAARSASAGPAILPAANYAILTSREAARLRNEERLRDVQSMISSGQVDRADAETYWDRQQGRTIDDYFNRISATRDGIAGMSGEERKDAKTRDATGVTADVLEENGTGQGGSAIRFRDARTHNLLPGVQIRDVEGQRYIYVPAGGTTNETYVFDTNGRRILPSATGQRR